MRRIAVLSVALVVGGLTASAQEGVFNVERRDLVCLNTGGELRVSPALRDDEEVPNGWVKVPEPVWLEPMPDGWRSAKFEVVIEGGKCIRRPIARDLDTEDYMLQHDVRNARKAKRDSVRNNPARLREIETLQGADEGAVDENTKFDLPRVPAEKRAETRARIDAANRPPNPREQ